MNLFLLGDTDNNVEIDFVQNRLTFFFILYSGGQILSTCIAYCAVLRLLFLEILFCYCFTNQTIHQTAFPPQVHIITVMLQYLNVNFCSILLEISTQRLS